MSLTSASTNAEVQAAYDDNADYDVEESTAKAAMFVQACRILLRRRPSSITVDGNMAAFSAGLVEGELRRAERWLASRRSGGSVRHLDFRNLRD